jgi:hypothetical protein
MEGHENEPGKDKSEEFTELDIHYDRTSSYRTFHADGFRGGITPKQNVFIDFYVERPAAPKLVKHEVRDGKLGPETKRGGRSGVVRSSEGGLIMNLNTALELYWWLEDQIDTAVKMDLISEDQISRPSHNTEEDNDA